MRTHMNRHRAAIAMVLVLVVAPALLASPIDSLSDELRILFEQLGYEMMPHFQTVAVTNHELGMAELGNFPRMYFSVSLGASVAGGFLSFIDRPGTFNLLNPLQLIPEDTRNSDIFRTVRSTLPYPMLRAMYGVGLADGYEVSFHAGVVPQQGVDAAIAAAGSDAPAVTASITNLGVRVRKVLIPAGHGLPAISAGLGYVYSAIRLGYGLKDQELDLGGSKLKVSGDAKFNTTIHSIGTDVKASAKFWVFHPFVGASVYYQMANYEAGISGLRARVTDSTTVVEPRTQPLSVLNFADLNVILNTGFDMRMGPFNFFLHGNYALTTRAPGALLGMRLQF